MDNTIGFQPNSGNESERQKQGQKGLIRIEVNSLSEPDIIQALYRGSQAGVEVLLNVRGICCLRPGVAGLSERITVVSIVDRYLEHSRILHFRGGGEDRIFISSADWMPRNLEGRVELLVPVEDEACRKRLLAILDVFFQDNVKARRLQPDGSYVRSEAPARKKAVRSQEVFALQAYSAARRVEQGQGCGPRAGPAGIEDVAFITKNSPQLHFDLMRAGWFPPSSPQEASGSIRPAYQGQSP